MWARNRSAGNGALPYLVLLATIAFFVIANAPSASATGKGGNGCHHGKGLWRRGRCGGEVVLVQPVVRVVQPVPVYYAQAQGYGYRHGSKGRKLMRDDLNIDFSEGLKLRLRANNVGVGVNVDKDGVRTNVKDGNDASVKVAASDKFTNVKVKTKGVDVSTRIRDTLQSLRVKKNRN